MITYWMRNISNTDYTDDTDDSGYKYTLLCVLNISIEDASF